MKMKMETAWVDWADGSTQGWPSAASQELEPALLPAAADASNIQAVLGALLAAFSICVHWLAEVSIAS